MSYTHTETVIETFELMGITVMNKRVLVETVDATIQFCETYGFEHVFPEDADDMEQPPLQDGEPFMYMWRYNGTNEMRSGIWTGMEVLPTNGMSFVFKLAESSTLWNDWAVNNNITINGDVVFGDQVHGDNVQGDQINVTIAPNQRGVAIGRGAKSTYIEQTYISNR